MSFAPGTKVSTPDGPKPIEEIVIGAKVNGYLEDTQIEFIGEVALLSAIIQSHMCCLTFSDGTKLNVTKEHQILTLNGWRSLDPDDTLEEHPKARAHYSQPQSSTNTLEKLVVGDKVISENKSELTLVSITKDPTSHQTHNLRDIHGSYIYFCEGIPVMSWGPQFDQPALVNGGPL